MPAEASLLTFSALHGAYTRPGTHAPVQAVINKGDNLIHRGDELAAKRQALLVISLVGNAVVGCQFMLTLESVVGQKEGAGR